jgi:hypothetical protein
LLAVAIVITCCGGRGELEQFERTTCAQCGGAAAGESPTAFGGRREGSVTHGAQAGQGPLGGSEAGLKGGGTAGNSTTAVAGRQVAAGIAGMAGAGGAAATPNLDGYYDIRFGAAPGTVSAACQSSWPDGAARLLFGTGSKYWKTPSTRHALERPSLWGPTVTALETRQDPSQVVLYDFDGDDGDDTVVRLVLPTDIDGFVGTGTATIRRHCADDTTAEFSVQVTLTRDQTPARLYADPPALFAPYAVSWGYFAIAGTEVLDFGKLWTSWDFASLLGLRNAEHPRSLPRISSQAGAWIGFHIDDPEEVSGTEQLLYLKTPFYDTAGIPVETNLEPVSFAKDEVVTGTLDFDVAEPTPPIGVAHYYPPNTAGAPCESGGCLELGPVVPCATRSRTFYSLWFKVSQPMRAKVRLALQMSGPQSQGYPVWVEPGMYAEYSLAALARGGFHPIANPVDDMTHTTGFFDLFLPFYFDSDRTHGGAFAFSCGEAHDLALDTAVKIIIERIELVPEAAVL